MKDTIGLDELVMCHTLSDNMAKLLKIGVQVGINTVYYGGANSGRTTLIKTLANDEKVKVIPIMSCATKDELEEIYKYSGESMKIILGDLRSAEDFRIAFNLINTRHSVGMMYHSYKAKDSINRIASDCMELHINPKNMINKIKILVGTTTLADGSRKVNKITEVLGYNEETEKVDLNDIYVYEVDKATYDTETMGINEYIFEKKPKPIINMSGKHRRVGKISDKLVEEMLINGIDKSDIQFLLEEPTEIEEYTGNID